MSLLDRVCMPGSALGFQLESMHGLQDGPLETLKLRLHASALYSTRPVT